VAGMASEVDRLTAGKYVLVTTFRKNGTPVPTPVWVVRDGDELVIWSAVDTGKIKRIRNNATVELTACDMRGTPSGPSVTGEARILDAERTEAARRLLRAKYGLIGWATVFGSTVRRGRKGSVGVAITLAG
jgi:uncharacterized protein